jgi:hypothetical protein
MCCHICFLDVFYCAIKQYFVVSSAFCFQKKTYSVKKEIFYSCFCVVIYIYYLNWKETGPEANAENGKYKGSSESNLRLF